MKEYYLVFKLFPNPGYGFGSTPGALDFWKSVYYWESEDLAIFTIEALESSLIQELLFAK